MGSERTMTWKSHLAFALCFVVAIGIWYQYGPPLNIVSPQKATVKYPYVGPGPTSAPGAPSTSKWKRSYPYKSAPLPPKTVYDKFKEVLGLCADIVTLITPACVLVTWAVTFFRRRRVTA